MLLCVCVCVMCECMYVCMCVVCTMYQSPVHMGLDSRMNSVK